MGLIRLIVGLGNPGERYEATRHNIGFRVVDALGERAAHLRRKTKWQAEWIEAHIGARRVFLMKPLTFMNRSGEAVAPAVRYFGIAPEELVVVYDDLDLPLGSLRLRLKGSHGGHNGMRSLIAALGSDAFPRLRIGIGRPAVGSVADYVLSPFAPEERPRAEAAVARARDALILALEQSFEQAMNVYNRAAPV